MGIWRRIKRDLILAFTSLQETTLAVAERVNDRVEEVKHSIEANELERNIQTDLAILGEKAFRKSDVSLNLLTKEPDFLLLLSKIDTRQKELAALETRMKEKPFSYFEQLLSQSHLVVQTVMITDRFPEVGKQIQSLSLPPQIRILLVRKKGKIQMVHGQTLIEIQDEVIFIGAKGKIDTYRTYWHDS